jgi:hypothetical protein
MSRLTNKPVLDGDPINAASLNTRFADFTQTNLNQFNVRDAAIDLPQLSTTPFMAPQIEARVIGADDWTHATFNTVAGQTTGAVPHVVRDSASLSTPLALGAGWTLNTDQVLRVYWDLSVRPRWTRTSPWVGSDWEWAFPNSSSGVTPVNNGTGCWAFWLQWDTTDATLTNWTNVPAQESFNTVVTGGRGGALLANCNATSIVPAANQVFASPFDGGDDGVLGSVDIGWTSVDGAWHYVPGSPVTIYGLRVVLTGPLGAYHAASNWLLRQDALAADAVLDYNGGSLQALLMRLQ